MPFPSFRSAALLLLVACAAKQATPEHPVPRPNIDPGRKPPTTEPATPEPEESLRPMVPADAAYAHGWMPLASTGVDQFLRAHPSYDGRNVLIGILDTGIDAGIPGLEKTSTGEPKILDLRDFSDEGAVPLQRVTPAGDVVEIAGHRLSGFGRVAALNTSGPYYGGVIREIPLGPPPASDLNGNGKASDTLVVVVTRATDGWVLLADTDGDGSLAGERPVHDYLLARETFAWAARGRLPRITLAANFSGGSASSDPRLDLVFDISSHGSHVAGIAGGHDLYGVPGFDGVAPGAQLLGLKIANSAQGSITTTGSMIRAIDYAIRFASARRLPLVLNLSFGVGNEIEGTARIDAMVDSVLEANPSLVFTISAGNDGPGLSTLGFPGSAKLAIGVGATLPAAFLSPGPGGARDDQLAYFSSRGGELAKPDLVTPGVAYSTVPRWSTGQEIEQGTSMAAPHAAGLAALLVSGLAQERHPIDARAIKQALMVTARPLQGATFIDEGTGLPEVGAAYRWLLGERPVPEIMVRALGDEGWTTAALHEVNAARSGLKQRFELVRSESAPPATYVLRSDAAWISAPARVTLTGPKTIIELRYTPSAVRSPGASIGTVSGWGTDSLVGPAFRLVSTLIAPEPVSPGAHQLRSGVRVEPATILRTFFRADSARPVEVQLSPASLGQKGLAFLHEPDGMPYREESARPIGPPQGEAVYQIDGRDVVAGSYEVDAIAGASQALGVNLQVTHSPLLLHVARDKSGATGTLTNTTASPVKAEVAMLLGGAERVETIVANNSAVRRIPFVAPAWARSVVVDVTMSREQWSRFTDFGVTLFDSVGRQIEKQPLNYAFGRLQAKLPSGHADMPVELALFPGFADTTDQSWTARASIRLYADTAIALQPTSDSLITIPSGKTATARFTLPDSPWPLGDAFFPLAVLAARADEHTWTREGGLPLPNPPIAR
jgi:tripeptidyl-peptidase-2